MNVTVIGLGAMGGGMARSLLRCDAVSTVAGFDLDTERVKTFHAEAQKVNKATAELPGDTKLSSFVTKDTGVVILVLVNEKQCQAVCFDGGDDNNSLESLVKPGAIVMVSSTVTPAWSKQAHQRFASKNIRYCDCPISGGPVRALAGEMTIMASGDEADLNTLDPLLQTMGKEIHIIQGGAGMGSTVKMVHQLLAGVHIVVAAEALALAAKAGLDVEQMYRIVQGAAGASWMFGDRGKRMISNPDDKVMSALAIFIKDLDIVYSEAKALQCPIPMATAALQQFISGASLGLTQQDDSKVVQVYETISGVSVQDSAKGSTQQEGDNIGDLWVLADGTKETILEVGEEERHNIVLSNDYTRVLKVKFGPNDTTCAHRHAEDSLYFFLVEGGLDVVNHVKGSDPACDCMEFGEVRYGTHKTDKPLVHRITNKSEGEMFCIDAEVLRSPPVTSPIPLVAEHHTLIKTRDKCRVYQLCLEPGASVTVTYPFFYLSIVLKGSTVQTKLQSEGGGLGITWDKSMVLGNVEWHSPTVGITLTNVGSAVFEQFIAEWR
ncbi:MAG: hypothetical protein SGILL_010490 [Bacillariaceae sp.]